MELSLLSIALLVLVLISIISIIFGKSSRSTAPGPVGIPILGNILQIKRGFPHETFTKWAQKYGPIYSMRLGAYRAFVLSDVKLIREAYNETHFCGRPNNEAFTLFSGGKYGMIIRIGIGHGVDNYVDVNIVKRRDAFRLMKSKRKDQTVIKYNVGVLLSDGPHWYEQRRFMLRHLKDFAFGKRGMESLIMDEVNELIANFKRHEGHPISPNRKFSLAILNGLWMIVTGTRHDHDDPVLNGILENLFKTINEIFSSGALIFIPQLRKYFPSLSGWNKTVASVEVSKNVFRKLVEEHKETMVHGSPRDFIDTYLEKIHDTHDSSSSFYLDVGYENLYAVIADFFMAGAETTANTLTWTILYLVKFPETQERLQEEIDLVIGKGRLPTLDDKSRMPYTEALLLEILRLSPMVVMGMFHYCTADTTFHGYDIPKGSYMCSNMHWIHRDPKIWGDPENFRPERFLSPDGLSVLKNDAFMGFSTGKRACLGEMLARDEFFLFLTSIFQRFDIRLSGEASLELEPSFMNVPKVFNVIMQDRFG